MLRNHIEIGLEVSNSQLEESFKKTPETDKAHTFQKRFDDAIKELDRFF
jgi:hypothetical protein